MNLRFISFSSSLLLLHSHFFHHFLPFQANIKSYPFCLKMSPKGIICILAPLALGPSIITPWEIKAGIPALMLIVGGPFWPPLSLALHCTDCVSYFSPWEVPEGGGESWVEGEAVFLPVPLCLSVFPGGSEDRVLLQCGKPRFDPWVGKMPWRKKWQPTPVFLPREFYGQRLASYSLWGLRVGHDWVSNTLTHSLCLKWCHL